MNISPSLSHFIVLNFYVSLWLSLSFIPLTGTSWQPAVLLYQYRLLGKGEIGNLDRCSGWQDSPLTPVVSMVKHLSGMTSLYSIYFFFLSLYLSINHPPRYSAGSCCVMLGQKLACAGIHFLLAHFQPKAPFSCITIFASNKQLSTLGEHHLLITVSSCFSFFFWHGFDDSSVSVISEQLWLPVRLCCCSWWVTRTTQSSRRFRLSSK